MDSTSSFVPVVIANEDATPLSQEDIAAINVAAEFVNSSDDERPASSYPLLDRRHYREDPSPVVDLTVPIPLTIGFVLDPDEEVRDFNVWETLTMVTATVPLPQETPDRHVLHQDADELESASLRRKRKRKGSKKERVSDETSRKHARKDDNDEDKDKRRRDMGGMSGRRHSGLRPRT